ncbi:MAG: SDR family oxidoreductase [Rikenellaceae bacterium]|jgi:NAD(P)-dependent dehydrogenase (short-subunit alcohol dehydrogenase family)|nr:SDR family oxidoreductase [Rikenellaceae bacterium]
MDDFNGKTVFVTGGANGIGRAIVTAFAEAGAQVSFCDRDEAAGRALEKFHEGICFYPVDVREATALRAAISEAVEAMGGLDILVNNVGISVFSPLTETPLEQFDAILATNLRPVFIASQEFVRRRDTPWGRQAYGRIINMASTRFLQSEAGTEAYSASKGGIVSLTHALAISLSGWGTTVNCISPGWIDTDHYPALRPEDHDQHPSGRVGTPDDIARVCLFLAHPENDFITGQNIVVDGGMTKKMIYIE